MRVLVTGGTGLVGSHTVRALQRAGHSVRLLVRSPDKAKRVFGADPDGVPEFRPGDIADRDSVEAALEGCEGVVHAAAMVAMAAHRAREVLETNARGVDHVIGGAHRRGIRNIVYVSSAGALFRPNGGPIASDDEVAGGKNAYARSKADAENYVRELQRSGVPIRTTYPTAVVGPEDPGLSEANHAVRTFFKITMVITSSGFQAIDARDLADVHVALLERGDRPARYVVGGTNLSWMELADLFDGLTGGKVRRLPAAGGLLRLAGRVGDGIKRLVDFDFPLTHEGMVYATQWPGADSAKVLAELPVSFRDPKETYTDTVRWLHRAGHLTADQVGRLADAE